MLQLLADSNSTPPCVRVYRNAIVDGWLDSNLCWHRWRALPAPKPSPPVEKCGPAANCSSRLETAQASARVGRGRAVTMPNLTLFHLRKQDSRITFAPRVRRWGCLVEPMLANAIKLVGAQRSLVSGASVTH